MFNVLRHKALIEGRKIPISLVVNDATTRDSSILTLSNNTLKTLQLSQGDTALVRGKKGNCTVLIVLVDDDHDDGFVYMNLTVRQNLHVELDDVITVQPCPDIQSTKRVTIHLLNDNTEDLTEYLFDDLLGPYFYEAYRPLMTGDSFTCRAAMRTARFQVIAMDPSEYGIVTQDTVIHWGVTKIVQNAPSYKRPDRVLKTFLWVHAAMRGTKTVGQKPWNMPSETRLGRKYHKSSSTEALITSD